MLQTFEVDYQSWRRLFLFCLGLAAGTAFCMKWMENDFWVNGEKFSILGLELFYDRQKLTAVLSGLTEPVGNILSYHLSFDFAFMAGVYPGITALCMMAREKTKRPLLKRLLFGLAALQLFAWALDITENYYLFEWMSKPVITDTALRLFHFIVAAKWIIALAGALIAIPLSIYRRKI